MAELTLSPDAEEDLINICIFTEERWGIKQRIKYHDQLENRMFDLADNPEKGRIRHELKNAPRFYHEGRHSIFYKEIDNGIEIVRILHG